MKPNLHTHCRQFKLDGHAINIHNSQCAHHVEPTWYLFDHMTQKKPKLGTGKRFKSLVSTLKKRHGKREVYNEPALAAYIGRRKYGTKKFAKLGASGRRRRNK